MDNRMLWRAGEVPCFPGTEGIEGKGFTARLTLTMKDGARAEPM